MEKNSRMKQRPVSGETVKNKGKSGARRTKGAFWGGKEISRRRKRGAWGRLERGDDES